MAQASNNENKMIEELKYSERTYIVLKVVGFSKISLDKSIQYKFLLTDGIQFISCVYYTSNLLNFDIGDSVLFKDFMVNSIEINKYYFKTNNNDIELNGVSMSNIIKVAALEIPQPDFFNLKNYVNFLNNGKFLVNVHGFVSDLRCSTILGKSAKEFKLFDLKAKLCIDVSLIEFNGEIKDNSHYDIFALIFSPDNGAHITKSWATYTVESTITKKPKISELASFTNITLETQTAIEYENFQAFVDNPIAIFGIISLTVFDVKRDENNTKPVLIFKLADNRKFNKYIRCFEPKFLAPKFAVSTLEQAIPLLNPDFLGKQMVFKLKIIRKEKEYFNIVGIQ